MVDETRDVDSGLTAIFIRTQVEIDWNGIGKDAVPHSTSYRPRYRL